MITLSGSRPMSIKTVAITSRLTCFADLFKIAVLPITDPVQIGRCGRLGCR